MTTRDLVVSIDPAGKNLGVAVLDTKTMLVNAYTVDWTDDNGLHNLRFQDYAASSRSGAIGTTDAVSAVAPLGFRRFWPHRYAHTAHESTFWRHISY